MDSMRVTLAIMLGVLFFAAMPANCQEAPAALGSAYSLRVPGTPSPVPGHAHVPGPPSPSAYRP